MQTIHARRYMIHDTSTYLSQPSHLEAGMAIPRALRPGGYATAIGCVVWQWRGVCGEGGIKSCSPAGPIIGNILQVQHLLAARRGFC